ncbi:teichoic acid biosynthesis protein F [Photobacterium gaetbulicola]|uniref:CDP-glycerol glycerophosphotransferase family protein n=1 Tax=Photobacterium gaetbulicola TaxID=1295392 RepID=UPI000B22CACD|nr:CDP-glycerol glycerophosphotransferase family protein [Photobacterium gaetbulicola]PSU14314.1 teichoic acid biosynthesis protein F [Photobacterium gaetbulicola]
MKRLKNKVKVALSKSNGLDLLFKYLTINIVRVLFFIKHGRKKVTPNKIIFECFQGKSIADSPFAIYKKMVSLANNFEFVWVVNSEPNDRLNRIVADSNIKLVQFGTKEYDHEYATAAFWITNCRLPFRFVKRKGQKYVQCWHGTPLKRLGLDVKASAYATSSLKGMYFSYLADSKRYDHFISPSEYASECFCSSFGIEPGKIIEQGYPRNDVLTNDVDNAEKLDAIRQSLGIEPGKKVILYAPTWRDNQYSKETGGFYFDNPLETEHFLSSFDDSYVFLFRGHYFSDSHKTQSRFVDVSTYNDVNDLYLISDALITDYSSVFFDYAILNRPIFFYMYDRAVYEKDVRGFYIDIDQDLPGPIFYDSHSLADALKSLKTVSHKPFNERFNPYEDGCSTDRVIEKILKG